VIAPVSQTSRTESSAMRMISSLGKETAQVAGEVTKSAAAGGNEKDATARQMVTILPRRITREIPESAVAELNETADAAKQAAEVAVAPRPTVELPAVARTVNIPGGTTRKSSNGPLTAGLVGLAVILFAGVAYLKCRKPSDTAKPKTQVGANDGNSGSAVDAGLGVGLDAPLAVDAAVVVIAADASPVPASVDAAPSKKYRDLLAKAKAALDEGDAEGALRFAVASIEDRATGKGYVTKADALRRLARTEEALTAITSALRMANDFAPAWEMKGRILWGAKRTGEATAAFERFLQLEPNGERADGIRALLGK
jgi:tetratricopeptide (TPR) repeat protein